MAAKPFKKIVKAAGKASAPAKSQPYPNPAKKVMGSPKKKK